MEQREYAEKQYQSHRRVTRDVFVQFGREAAGGGCEEPVQGDLCWLPVEMQIVSWHLPNLPIRVPSQPGIHQNSLNIS